MFGAERDTRVGIDGDAFTIDGRPTYEGRTYDGHRVEGLLWNCRMVQAIFDDDNSETRGKWAYPDTGEWNPERNVREFCAAMPEWYDHGLRAVSVNLQGGSPEGYSDGQPWTVSAYRPDGSLKEAWLDRLERVLDRADDLGMVAILGLFYFGQDEVLADEAAIRRAVENAVGWLHDREYANVLIEVNNECTSGAYDHDVLRADRVVELIDLVREAGDGRYPVSTSFNSRLIPTDEVIAASDYVLLHANGIERSRWIGELVRNVRNRSTYDGEPIVFNEGEHYGYGDEPNHMSEALSAYASWGHFDPGESNYRDGFQCPPVEWSIDTPEKERFFEYVARVTGN